MKNKKVLLYLVFSAAFAFLPYAAFAQKVVEEEEQNGFIESATRFIAFIFSQVPRWVGAVIILVLFVGLSKMAKKAVESRMLEKIAPEHQELTIVTSRMASVIVLVVGIAAALGVIGVNLMNLIAAVGFGISLGMQDFFSNFIAGIMILVSRPFVIGDFIKVGDQLGKVQEIQSRVTVLRSIEGVKVVIPNSMLFKDKLTNLTGYSQRRFFIEVGVEYRTDLAKAIKVCMEVMKTTQGVLINPAPVVYVKSFGDSAIVLQLRFWVPTHSKFLVTRSEVYRRLKKAFDEVGIVIPFPMRTLVLDRDSEAAVLPVMNVDSAAYEKKLSDRMEQEKQFEEETVKIVEKQGLQEPPSAQPTPEKTREDAPLSPDEDKPGAEFLKQQ